MLVYIGGASSGNPYSIKELCLEYVMLEAEIVYNRSNDILCDVVIWNLIFELDKDDVKYLIDINVIIENVN